MFRLALNALGGIYKQAHIIITLGDEKITPLPNKWEPYFGNTVKLNWVAPELYKQHSYFAQADARWKYDHDEYNFIVFCDADTLLIRPFDGLLIKMWQSPTAMGVIAHYPFPHHENNKQIWFELAKKFTGKPIEFNYRNTLIPYSNESEYADSPFYINFGFLLMTSRIIKTMRDTYVTMRPRIGPLIKKPFFAGQIALTLSLLAHDIPTHALGLRYNFPNDVLADSLHPKELADIRLLHYLRTDIFDRQTIFTNENAFMDFLSLKLSGSNKVFQDHIRKLTNGKYPF